MKKVLIPLVMLFLWTACQESLEERCQRECVTYTKEHCPLRVAVNIILDSLTFEEATHTLHYYYKITGIADKENAINPVAATQALRKELKNSPNLKIYRDKDYNFTYTYHSEKNPKKIWFEVNFEGKDCISSIKKDTVTWVIQSSIDAITYTKNICANIHSINFINQDFPYEGETYAKIIVRYMKRYGNHVMIEIDRGQIYGIDASGTNYVIVRFDGESPKKFYFDYAEDGNLKLVFLRNANDFINKCKEAKDITVEVPMYKLGRYLYRFHVDKPLVWSN